MAVGASSQSLSRGAAYVWMRNPDTEDYVLNGRLLEPSTFRSEDNDFGSTVAVVSVDGEEYPVIAISALGQGSRRVRSTVLCMRAPTWVFDIRGASSPTV